MPKIGNRPKKSPTSKKAKEVKATATESTNFELSICVPASKDWQWKDANSNQATQGLPDLGLPRQTDLTVIYEKQAFVKKYKRHLTGLNSNNKPATNWYGCDKEGLVTINAGSGTVKRYKSSARFAIASCNNGANLALTMRLKNEVKRETDPREEYQFLTKKYNYILSSKSDNESNDEWLDPSRSGNTNFIVPNYEISRVLWTQIANTGMDDRSKNAQNASQEHEIIEPCSGLVIIAGSTNSGKSELARSIISDYLQRRKNAESGPNPKMLNLVTLEDPIEEWWPDIETKKAIKRFYNQGICYIPRRLGCDTDSLKNALKDSKRQSPACFYVGEIRSKDDWMEVIDFATSGHLIVVTTHATNLRETIQKVLTSCDADTPQRRKIIADSLCAVVHAKFQSYNTADDKEKYKVQIPSAWIANSRSRNELVRDGLTSIIGNDISCFNREQFAMKTLRGYFWPAEQIKPLLTIDEITTKLLPSIKKQDIKEVIG
jgi:Tfp pilus assembly pilus retraction ATPase PilT